MRKDMRRSRSLAVRAMTVFLGCTAFGQTMTAGESVRNDTSPPLRDLATLAPPLQAPSGTSEVPLGTIPLPPADTLPDTVLQTNIAANVSAGIVENFEGYTGGPSSATRHQRSRRYYSVCPDRKRSVRGFQQNRCDLAGTVGQQYALGWLRRGLRNT